MVDNQPDTRAGAPQNFSDLARASGLPQSTVKRYAGEVLKQIGWSRTRPTLHHFLSYRQEEVDLLLEASDRRIVGIEVKASARVEPRDFRHLARLRDDLGARFVNGLVMHTGRETVAFGDRLHAVPVWGLWR